MSNKGRKWKDTSNHWSKQPWAKEVWAKIIPKLRLRKPNSGSFKKGHNSFVKGKKLPWAKKAAEGREKSGMYANKKRHAGDFKKGLKPWNKGKKGVMPIPWNKGTRGVMPAPSNKGKGLGTPLNHLIRRCDKYIKWRLAVFVRDNYKCVLCGKGGKLHADHKKAFALICKENNITDLKSALRCKQLWDIKNGRTLCIPCHRKTPTYSGKYQTNLHKYPRTLSANQ